MLMFYSGCGRWYYEDFFNTEGSNKVALTDLVRETGLFKLGDINQQEIRYSEKATVYYLNSCDEHKDGVTAPFIPWLDALYIPFFEPDKPLDITLDDIFKENTEVADDASAGKGEGDRQSQLYIFIWRVHQSLSEKKKPTAQELWNEIQHRYKDHDIDGIIQEVDSRQILWCSGYGNEQRQLRTTFDKTLSNIRKSHPF